MDGVKANGSILLFYEYVKPGEEKPIRKMGYAVDVPGFDMYLGTGAYLDDLDAKMKPIAWLLGLAILGIAVISGSIAWMIGRSISKPLGLLGDRMQALADGKLDGEIPGLGRGDEVGAMAATVQIFKDNAVRIRGLEQAEDETQAAPRPSAAPRWRASPAISNAASPASSVRCLGRRRHADHGAVDDLDRERRQLPRRHRQCGLRKFVEQCRHRCRRCRGALQLGCAKSPARWRAPARSPARRWAMPRRTNATVRCAVDRRREDRRGGQADPLDRRADQPFGAERHDRSGACGRVRPRFRGRRFRSEGAGQPDREGDRGNLGAGRGDAGFHQRSGDLDRRHHRNHRADERDHGLAFRPRSISRAMPPARSPATSSRSRPARARSTPISAASPRRPPPPARRRPKCCRMPANSTTSPACCAARSMNSCAKVRAA